MSYSKRHNFLRLRNEKYCIRRWLVVLASELHESWYKESMWIKCMYMYTCSLGLLIYCIQRLYNRQIPNYIIIGSISVAICRYAFLYFSKSNYLQVLDRTRRQPFGVHYEALPKCHGRSVVRLPTGICHQWWVLLHLHQWCQQVQVPLELHTTGRPLVSVYIRTYVDV